MENDEKQDFISDDDGTDARQEQVSESPSAYGAHAAVQSSRKNKRRFRKFSIVGAAISVLLALALLICSIAGFLKVSVGNCVLLIILLVVLAGVLLLRDRMPEVLQRGLKVVRPVVIVCAVPVGLCLVEIPSNTAFLSMGLEFLLLNLLILAVLFCIIYFIGQRSRLAVLVFLLMCLALGATDYFLIEFKGAPIMPSDLSAISTAFSVAGGYTYDLGDSLVVALAVFLVYCIILALMPKVALTLRRAAVSCGIAVVVAVCFGWWVTSFDIEDASGHVIDTWDLTETYSQYGAIYCFAGLVQDLAPVVPDGYSDEKAEEILNDASTFKPKDHGVLADTDDLAVVVVMNETFADLSTFPYLEGSEAYPSAYYEIAEDSLEAGSAFVSVFAGGTCNSEFEFLTGSNMSFVGSEIYPYTSYDLSEASNLAGYFSSHGYATHAIHPGPATNWNRSKIYEELGFDDFADETCFEGADTLRDLVTDRETYDYVLSLLDEDSDSQFIFDVTMQNHGGYDVGTIPKDETVSIMLPDGTESSELNEYASSIQHSDADLAYLVEELNEMDRPVLLCFFGDHQPEISTWLYDMTHDEALVEDSGLAAAEELREVPYFIWANASARGIDPEDADDIFGDTTDEELDEELAEEVNEGLAQTQDEEASESEDNEQNARTARRTGNEEESDEDTDELTGDGDTNALTHDEDESEDEDSDTVEDTEGSMLNETNADGTRHEYVYERLTDGNIMSLSYLGAHLVNYIGLPLTDYQKFLLKTNQTILAMDYYGYLSNDKIWRYYGWGAPEEDILNDYAIVQYYNLFG